jgi:L,D-peptidoglycan transpeptidase YkuD (ErfK/YbiS/YcfS/YnhG family)
MTRTPRPRAGLLTALALVAALALSVAPVSAVSAAPGAPGATVRLDGVTVRLRPGTSQVVTVNRTTGWHARVTFWVREGGRWTKRLATRDGRIGYGGLHRPAQRHQGDGSTPRGTFGLPSVFGTHRRGTHWSLPYHRIRSGDYWVGDNSSRHYNRLRSRADGGFRWWLPASDDDASERLADYRRQYEYAVTTTFNAGQVRHRGFAIFLHVNGRGATAGCVSAPRWFLRKLVRRLTPGRHPVIAIGG